MSIREQAQAEALKQYPSGMYHIWDGNLPVSSEKFGELARESFKSGYVAGHEATRRRIMRKIDDQLFRVGSGELSLLEFTDWMVDLVNDLSKEET